MSSNVQIVDQNNFIESQKNLNQETWQFDIEH